MVQLGNVTLSDPTTFNGLDDHQIYYLFGRIGGPSARYNLADIVFMAKTHKIIAIKILRTITGLCLKDAKDVIEVLAGFTKSVNPDDYHLPASSDIQALKRTNAQLEQRNESLRAELATRDERNRLLNHDNEDKADTIRALDKKNAALLEACKALLSTLY